MPQQPSACRECRHILSSGRKCHSPALRDRPFCFHHARLRNYTGRNQRSIDSVELPLLEDHSSIRIAINQVIFSLTHGRIDHKLAGRLLYAIQLAQNSINRAEDPDPAEVVTDYLDGRYGDIVAPAGPGSEFSTEPTTGDDVPLLTDYEKEHSGHGDTCWQPANADYLDHLAEQATDVAETPELTTMPEASARSSAVINATPKPGPQKPGPQKPGPQKSGPWNHPLLDHIVRQLQSGISESEVAAQLTTDLFPPNAHESGAIQAGATHRQSVP